MPPNRESSVSQDQLPLASHIFRSSNLNLSAPCTVAFVSSAKTLASLVCSSSKHHKKKKVWAEIRHNDIAWEKAIHLHTTVEKKYKPAQSLQVSHKFGLS